MKRIIKHSTCLSIFVFSIGILIVYVSYLISKDILIYQIDENFPNTLEIFFNNVKFVLIFALPIFGWVYYGITFLIIYSFIGVSIANMGIAFTLSKLLHLPIELFGLTLPVVVSYQICLKWLKKKNELSYGLAVKLFAMSAVILFIAAVVEGFLI